MANPPFRKQDFPSIHNVKRCLVKQKGFSLIEMVVGMALLGFIVVSGVMALRAITKNSLATNLEAMAHLKLRSVSEQIRSEAVSFDTMNESTGILRLPDMFKPITVRSTTSPIDPATRTRIVMLKATWKDVNAHDDKIIISSFTVASIRGKMSGGEVKFKVIDYITSGGVPNVKISGRGQDINEVIAFTDAAGVAVLKNVLYSAASTVTVNGEFAGNYFYDVDTPGVTESTFTHTYSLNVEPSVINDIHFVTPIKLHAPGKISGTVTDVTDPNIKVANAEVHLAYYFDKLLIKRLIPDAQRVAVTDVNGEYSFPKLIPTSWNPTRPGDAGYTVFLKGSSQYTGFGTQWDKNAVSNPNLYTAWFKVYSGQTHTKNFATIKKGSLTGDVYSIDETWSLRDQANATNRKVKVVALRTNGQAYDANPGQIEFSQTFVWINFFNNATHPDYDRGKNESFTLGTGDYRFNYFTPIITDPAASAITTQYNWTLLTVGSGPVPAPFTPIVVRQPGNAGQRRLMLGADHGDVNNAVFLPTTFTKPDFRTKVRTNQTETEDLYLLDRRALAHVSGQLEFQDGAGTRIDPTAYTWEYKNVGVTWDLNGYGAVIFQTHPNNDPALFERNYRRPVTNIGTNLVFGSYNMDNGAPLGACLPPNMGADRTVIRFRGRAVQAPPNRHFAGFIFSNTQVWNPAGNQAVAYVPENSLDIAAGQLKVNVWRWDGTGWQLKWPNVSVTVVDGKFTTDAPLADLVETATEFQEFNSPSLQLNPGDSINNNNLVIRPTANVNLLYTLQVVDNNAPLYSSNRGPCNGTFGVNDNRCKPHFTFDTVSSRFETPTNFDAPLAYDGNIHWANSLQLNRIQEAPIVHGKVIDPDGVPIINASVVCIPKGTTGVAGKMPTKSANTVLNVDGNGRQFKFLNIRFIVNNAESIKITVTAPGFQPVSVTTITVDGMSWEKDIMMSPVPVVPPPPPTDTESLG